MNPGRLLRRSILLGALLVLLTTFALADAVTDTVTVCIGYFGWSEDQYVEKATYHWTELDDLYGGALDTHEVCYSYYSGTRTYLVLGRGFYVRDLLEYAGVDLNSIASVDFFFAGAPVISAEQTDLSLTVGSDHALHVAVSAEDALLDEYVRGHLAYSSSDETVVRVRADGTLTPVGAGTALVTVSYGSSSATVTVRGDELSGSGGTGAGGGASGAIGAPNGDSTQDAPAAEQDAAPDHAAPQKTGVYILSGGALTRESSPAGVAAGDKMGSGSVQLELPPQQTAPVLPTLITLALCALLGFAYGVLRYRKLR